MLSLKRILALLIIMPIAAIMALETGFLIRNIKTHWIVPQHQSDNKKLEAELQNFAESLAKCAGLPKPKLVLVKNTIEKEVGLWQSEQQVALTLHKSFLDIIFGNIKILVREDIFQEEIKETVAHEIAHQILQPSYYHVILDEILDKFSGPPYSRELAATELGNKLISQCFKTKA